jgi:hypothetical protein
MPRILPGATVVLLALTCWNEAGLFAQMRWSGGAVKSETRGVPSKPAPVGAPFHSSWVFRPEKNLGRRTLPLRLPWFGLVWFDSFWWAPPDDASAGPPPAPPLGDGRPTGGLQLDVEPRRALVYVDGWYVGVAESFSGYFSHLDLPAGPHVVEFLAPDYDPFWTELTVTPGKTTTYRGLLNRR